MCSDGVARIFTTAAERKALTEELMVSGKRSSSSLYIHYGWLPH